jgi:hypothetical protein
MKNTKSFLKLAMVAVASFALAVTAIAQTPTSLSFIGNGDGYNLLLNADTTNTTTSTNVWAQGYHTASVLMPYTNASSGLVQSNWMTTNAPNWFTNTIGGISDVNLWANRDGTALIGNINVDMYGMNGWFTNQVHFTFQTIGGGGGNNGIPANIADSTAQNTWEFMLTGNSSNHVSLSTNIPTGFLQGARRLRLTVSTPAQGLQHGTNGWITGVWLNGYKPTGAE